MGLMRTGARVRPGTRYLHAGLLLTMIVGLGWQADVALGQIASGATLTVLRGNVSVVRTDGTGIAPAGTGLLLGVGDRVATVGRAAALVTFFDGSEVELGADTTIAIHALDGGNGSLISIIVENVLGSTVHRVAPLTTPGASYQILSAGTVPA
jgi:hypothetical protein